MTRPPMLVALALASGLLGGLAGGLVAIQLDGDDGGPAPAAPTATVAGTLPGSDGTFDEAPLRSAIDTALPAVVTVIADGPLRLDEDGETVQQRSLGSGVVITDSGHIVTNYHVVRGAAELKVVLASGEEREAVFVSDDAPFTDLAVLRISPQGLRSIRFGDSEALRPGDPVAAITGSSFVGGNSVRVGAVSGTGRAWAREGVILEDLVQTDAGVNQGDSGGALVTADGQLVGLITTVVQATPTGQAVQGIAFAQSAASLEPVVADIVTRGSHPRPRLGIERVREGHLELTPELAEERGLPVSFGALIIDVPAGSPAAAAGVEVGDIIVGLGDTAVDFEHPFTNLLKVLRPGDRADLVVLRGGEQLRLSVETSAQ